MNKDEKEAIGTAALLAPVLPFVYLGLPVLIGVIGYSLASGMQSFLSLPAWVLGITAAALVAGTMACILGRIKGIAHAPVSALLLLLAAGLVQINRAMLEAAADSGTHDGNSFDRMHDAMGQIASYLALGLPWILAVVVIGISAAKIYSYVTILKARRETT
ncbi:hypothetical protein [Candidatus Burkholderia verschuerenii]|uniref:hypothetical protein n=1 Tax=Candidatus Burkholderia verschuerenii TaxID=242163 RepID=UPI00067C5359|nr:hypothetical protein [Candidatus Burkholderia verschuerenii]